MYRNIIRYDYRLTNRNTGRNIKVWYVWLECGHSTFVHSDTNKKAKCESCSYLESIENPVEKIFVAIAYMAQYNVKNHRFSYFEDNTVIRVKSVYETDFRKFRQATVISSYLTDKDILYTIKYEDTQETATISHIGNMIQERFLNGYGMYSWRY